LQINQDQIQAANRQQYLDQNGEEQQEGSMMSDDTFTETEETHSYHESEGSADFSDASSDSEEAAPPVIRIYDARFKIPAQSNLGQLMAAKGNDL